MIEMIDKSNIGNLFKFDLVGLLVGETKNKIVLLYHWTEA